VTLLPVVERELRVNARRPATFWVRVGAAAFAVFLGAVMLLVAALFGTPGGFGQTLFFGLGSLLLVFCLFEGARVTADCLSEEKREGTLGLLFLTDLRGYDVVLGKLVATSLRTAYAMIGVLPVLGLSVILGGVTGGEFWRTSLALANLLFFSLAVGMFVSALSRDGRNSLVAALVLGGAICALPLIAAALLEWRRATGWAQFFAALSPFTVYTNAGDALYRLHGGVFWWSLLTGQCWSWLALGLAAWWTPHSWQERPFKARAVRRRHTGNPIRRRHLLDTQPMVWLFNRHRPNRWLVWLLLALSAAAAVTGLAMKGDDSYPWSTAALTGLWGMGLLCKLTATSQACRALADTRESRLLEQVLATPLTDREVVGGHYRAIWNTWRTPVVLQLLILYLLALGLFFSSTKGSGRMNLDSQLYGILLVIVTVGEVLDLLALVFAGSWFGLSSGRANASTIKTILLVLILPSLVCCPVAGPFFMASPIPIVTDIVFMVWASGRLRRYFRVAAGLPPGARFSAFPARLHSVGTAYPVPPVVRP
jgi:hypothetical protein